MSAFYHVNRYNLYIYVIAMECTTRIHQCCVLFFQCIQLSPLSQTGDLQYTVFVVHSIGALFASGSYASTRSTETWKLVSDTELNAWVLDAKFREQKSPKHAIKILFWYRSDRYKPNKLSRTFVVKNNQGCISQYNQLQKQYNIYKTWASYEIVTKNALTSTLPLENIC